MNKPTYEELVEALISMAAQYLYTTSDPADMRLSHDFMSAGEECLEILERLGKVETRDGVYYYWTKG